MVSARVGRFGCLIAAGIALAGASPARADTILNGTVSVDNAFYAYVSTSDSALGTLVGMGNSWGTAVNLSAFTLTAGQTYYLHVEGINYGGPGGFIGDFTLGNTGFHFANGSQSLLTETADWRGGYIDDNSDPTMPQTWVMPTGGVFSEGAYGVGPWGNGISTSFNNADWIWPSDSNSDPEGVCGYCTVAFSTTIIPGAAPTGVPEPVTISLFGAGLAGAIALRRKAKKKA